LAIFVLVLWLATAGVGLTLLRAGAAARREAASPVEAERTSTRIGAIPLTAEGRPPPGPHVRVAKAPGEHPLLEFCHPALAIIGIACWTMFVFVHYRPFAWIAFGVLVATVSVGLGWLASTSRAAGRPNGSGWTFPRRLVVTHGLVAACSITLTVLTALLASRG